MSKPLPTIPPYGENAIDVKNLTFQYRKDASQHTVLQNLDLTLRTGSRCLLIGANGSVRVFLYSDELVSNLTNPI